MATRGPRPKPTKLHVVDGTFRPGRHAEQAANEPQPEGKLEKPKWLKGKASKIWDEWAPKLDWLTTVDSPVLALWCGLEVEVQTDLEDMTASRISQWRTLASELGMTPAGRARIGASGGKKKADPTEKYFD